MTRYSGFIGIRQAPVEESPGIYTTEILEVPISGDIRRESARWQGVEIQQETPRANHIISILATEDIVPAFLDAVYITWQGRKWVIASVEYLRPRLNLTLGGLYNGK